MCAASPLPARTGGLKTNAPSDPDKAQHELVERRLAGESGAFAEGLLDSLLAGASPAVADWFERKARLADGTSPGVVLVAASSIAEAIERDLLAWPQRSLLGDGLRTDWRSAVHALLLRNLTGMTFDQIGAELKCSRERARRLADRADRALLAEPAFASRIAVIAHDALSNTYANGPVVAAV